MTDAEFWEVERELWLGGPEAFRRWVPETCLMVFPPPTGILTGAAVIDSVTGAPRWERVAFSGGLVRRTGSEAAVLAYAAQAVRPGGMPYAALCSSCYVRQAGAWWLVQHQQTPGREGGK